MWVPASLSTNILSVGLVCLGGYFFHKTDAKDASNKLAKGFGDHIAWKNFSNGLEEASLKQLPIMLIIHQSWCAACKALKPKFSSSAEIHRLSEKFIMINTGDGDEPKDEKYAPDGSYFPRILFLNPDGEVLTEYYNKDGNRNYKYYYPEAEGIVATMKRVSSKFVKKEKLPDEL